MKSSYTVMDLRKSTQFVMGNHPHVVAKWHSKYYEVVHNSNQVHGGILCSMLGDCTGSIFSGDNHEEAAIRSAACSVMRLRTMGFPLESTVGIDSGEIYVQHAEFDHIKFICPLGGPVIVSYRVEDIAAASGYDLLITENTYSCIRDVRLKSCFHSIGKHTFKGVENNIPVWGGRAQEIDDLAQLQGRTSSNELFVDNLNH